MAQSIIDEAIVEINRLRKVPLESKYSGFIFPCREKLKVKCIRPIALARAVKRSLEWPLKDKKGKPLFGANGKPATENLVGIDCFTPHDLRRTAATFMSQSGILDEHIDAVLNHTKTGIIATYNKNKYDKEKQVALEAWERKLQSILTGSVSNVININQGRRKAA
jgi:integrase